MMCQRIGRPPISIIGFGRSWLSSEMRVPSPPASITTLVILSPGLARLAQLFHEVGQADEPAAALTLGDQDRAQILEGPVHILVDDDVIIFLIMTDFVQRLPHSGCHNLRRVLRPGHKAFFKLLNRRRQDEDLHKVFRSRLIKLLRALPVDIE